MQSIFNKIFITKAEYSIIKTMHASERLRWLFDTFDATTLQQTGMDLSSFFAEVQDNLERYKDLPILPNIADNQLDEIPDDRNHDFVDVMIDDDNIMIESNSLRALRIVTSKFMESGYMLQRDIATEKLFKKDKTTRYIRVFRIINFINSICLN